MGADAFIVFYGIRYSITSDEDVEAVERAKDPRIIVAKRAKLQAYWGRLTDGEPYFLLIGTRLGVFGIENQSQSAIDGPALERIMRDTRDTLSAAGLSGEPQLHLQLEAQY
jgi:hypothetical protein